MDSKRPNWEGLLKWTLSHSDGTNPPRNLSEEDKKWFMEAMQAQTVDITQRMKEITFVMKTPENVLEADGVTPEDIEGMLDELQEHVESIDMANDLHSIGGLVPLLGYLKSSHSTIRAKAAEVVTTIVQNNPKCQQLVMDLKGLEPLLSVFTSDPDVVSRTKALGAISSLIRDHEKGIEAFHLASGYAALRDALKFENVRLQRKALNLVHYLLNKNRSDCDSVKKLGFPRILTQLASSEDADVREAALRGLRELVLDSSGKADSSLSEEHDKLKQILFERIKRISEMSAEDLGAAREEILLLDSLWSACFIEPCPLRNMERLFLGEDAPPPDIASQHFQPPLRAWAANGDPDTKPNTGKKAAPLLIGPPADDAS